MFIDKKTPCVPIDTQGERVRCTTCFHAEIPHLILRRNAASTFPSTPFTGSKEQLQSEREYLAAYASFSLRTHSLSGRFLRKTRFFIAFDFILLYYNLFLKKSQQNFAYLFFKRSRISSKSLVFAIAFSSAIRASSAAFAATSAAAAASAAAFASIASTTCCA